MNALKTGNRNLIKSAIHIAYFMRGGVQYEDVLERSYFERNEMIDYINERLKSEAEKCKESKGKLQANY
jgi:hypothetical protein